MNLAPGTISLEFHNENQASPQANPIRGTARWMQTPNTVMAGGGEDFPPVLLGRETHGIWVHPWRQQHVSVLWAALALIALPGAHSVTTRIDAELKYADAEQAPTDQWYLRAYKDILDVRKDTSNMSSRHILLPPR